MTLQKRPCRINYLNYRPQRGADVDVRVMIVIETCRSNDGNPFKYLLAVARNQEVVESDPGRWMHWNYRQSLLRLRCPVRL